MNLFKTKYNTIRQQLRIFGEESNCKIVDPEVRYSAAFWQNRYFNETICSNQNTWSYLLSEYMHFGCNYEERKFIDLMFFQCQKIVFVSFNFHLSERACQTWRTEILNNIAGLAIQSDLIYLDVKNCENADDKAVFEPKLILSPDRITDAQWLSIEPLIPHRKNGAGRPSADFRNVVDAALFVQNSGTPWMNLPDSYGAWKTVYNNFLLLRKSGAWDSLMKKFDTD